MPTRFGDRLIDRLLRERAEEVGPIIDRVLRKRGLTQYRLALHANLGPDVLNKIIRGQRAPTETQTLRIIAGLFLAPEDRRFASWILAGC